MTLHTLLDRYTPDARVLIAIHQAYWAGLRDAKRDGLDLHYSRLETEYMVRFCKMRDAHNSFIAKLYDLHILMQERLSPGQIEKIAEIYNDLV